MDFTAAVRSCLFKYAVFTGRAPRSEFWFFTLFCWVLSAAAEVIAGDHVSELLDILLLLPNLAVAVRRLHDTGRSGWWLLIICLPIIGWIFWLIWACTRGDAGENRFGSNPLPDPAPQF